MASSVKANLLDDGVVDTLVSVGAKSGVHTSASGFKEKLRVRYEKLGILEQRAMAGVRIHNQLRIRNVLRKRERVDCGHHDVVIAVRREVDNLGEAQFLRLCGLYVTGRRRDRMLRTQRAGHLDHCVTHRTSDGRRE